MAIYLIQQKKVAEYRACKLVGLSRSVLHYAAKKPEDEETIKQVKLIAYQHKRYGFKKIFRILKRKGFQWNHKRVYRIYKLLRLHLRKKPKKRIPSREKVTLYQPKSLNQVWSLDYMQDILENGRKFRTVNIIDDFNREALVIKVFRTLPSILVIQVLDEIAYSRGYPKKLRMDNGPENISNIMKKWGIDHNVIIEYIQPGKPAQNGYIERFNRTYREEILDMNLFASLNDVQKLTDEWIIEYNTQRPHASLNHLAPAEYSCG